ncbi:MAG: PD-(D/E)XK nuclease domain-containing protein, partial [Deltaproteobacteria bacterium]|nr:PD-(D/E)XK nuclease domain-containing protein [Deltaproteobacteria bacterium]
CYTWDGQTKIFNPWSILFAFKKNLFGDYWTQTGGVASFLAGLIKNNLIDFTTFKSDQSITESLNAIELGKDLDQIPVLFQSGYLTVDRVEKSSGTAKFFLKIPNLEVRSGLIPLLLSLKPIQDPLGVWRNACSMLSSLIQLDAEGFENAFGSFLAEFPYNIHVPAEAYYHSLFQAAMFLADANIKTEVSVGDGRYDAKITAPDGTIFVIEIKYCPASYDISQDSQTTVNDSKKKLELLKKMKVKAKEAMKQIDDKNYTKAYWEEGHDIYKVALVVGGRTEVLVEFMKEEQRPSESIEESTND